MYTFREIKSQEAWDRYASTFKQATFINSFTWIEFMRSVGVEFIPIGIYDDDSLEGLLPVKLINAKRGRYLHVQHAPLIDWRSKTLRDEVNEYLKDLARKNKACLIRISPLLKDSEESRNILRDLGYIPSTAHEVDAEHTLLLDLAPEEEDLLKQMRKNTRYYIRKAEKIGVETEIISDMSKFDIFWEIFTNAVDRNKWVAYSREYVEKEFRTFLEMDQARMFLSKYEGQYISAAIFTYFNGQSFYHHSGSLTEFRNIPSTYSLQWEAIKYAKEIGCREHNFWGVVDKEDKDHPWYGLSLFKYGFGGKERKMVHSHDRVLGIRGTALRAYEFFENKSHGY